MGRKVPLILVILLVTAACAIPTRAAPTARLVATHEETARDSTGRCDYGLEGAVGMGAAVAVLRIVRGYPAEQLAYVVPISAGLGWLWGRFLMPPRARCRVTAGSETADTTVQAEN
jgi:hypothetical protein